MNWSYGKAWNITVGGVLQYRYMVRFNMSHTEVTYTGASGITEDAGYYTDDHRAATEWVEEKVAGDRKNAEELGLSFTVTTKEFAG